MDAESAARSRPAGADPGDRLRGLALVVAASAVLAGGGAWWTLHAPVTAGPPEAASRADDGPSDRRVDLDVRSGVPVHVVDPATGRVTVSAGNGRPPAARVEGVDESSPATGVVWRVRTTITAEEGLVRRSYARNGDRYLLQFRCTGPGELLIVVDGARYAGPLTSGCAGSVTTVTEVTGVGGPVQVSLSTVNEQPVRVAAQLMVAP